MKKGNIKRQKLAVIQKLKEHSHQYGLKIRVQKKLFDMFMVNKLAEKQKALEYLRENCIVKRVCSITRQLEVAFYISDKNIESSKKTYFRLLCSFNQQNPWLKRVLTQITKSVKIDPQIAFWRLKDIKTVGTSMNAGKLVKLKKMFEIIHRHYQMEISRSFWKIDRCLDMEQSMNNSFFDRGWQGGLNASKEDLRSPMDVKGKGNAVGKSVTDINRGKR